MQTGSVQLVLAVARLGEADLAGWWRSNGLSAVGDYMLDDLFPRTAAAAGAEIALWSAASRHRDLLPARTDLFHLFAATAQPFRHANEWLAECKSRRAATDLLTELRSWRTRERAELAITDLLGGSAVGDGERIGATIRLGVLDADDLVDDERCEFAARRLAAAYIDQARDDLAVPYFDLA